MKWLVMAAALASAAPGFARDLPVPPGKGWQHAATGVVLTSQLAGLSRTAISDSTTAERDVSVQYRDPGGAVEATLYLFHPAIPSAGMWFDRAQATLEARDLFRHAAPATIDPIAFAAHGGTTTDGLRQVYAIPDGPSRSTGLAVVRTGEWIVSVRMTARSLTADQLDARLMQLLGAVRWPAAAAGGAVAAPIRTCSSTLTFGKARRVKPNPTDLLMSLMGAVSSAKAPTDVPVTTWCREGERGTAYGVFRGDADDASYVMALGDAGSVISVQRGLMAQVENRKEYSVMLTGVDGMTQAFPSFDAMPAPKQVWSIVNGH